MSFMLPEDLKACKEIPEMAELYTANETSLAMVFLERKGIAPLQLDPQIDATEIYRLFNSYYVDQVGADTRVLAVQLTEYALKHGQISLLEYLHTNYPFTLQTYINPLQSAYKDDTENDLLHTIQDGHLCIIQFLWKHYRKTINNYFTIQCAAKYGQIEIVEWLASVLKDNLNPNDVLAMAWLHHQTELVDWLLVKNFLIPISKHWRSIIKMKTNVLDHRLSSRQYIEFKECCWYYKNNMTRHVD